MEFFEAIRNRGSYRSAFTAQPVPLEDLRQLVDAGIRAPSGMNGQTTSFAVVTDPDLRKEIARAIPTPATETAQAFLVVMTEHRVTPCGLAFEIEDYAASVENILLAAAALGYATVWMDGMTRSPAANDTIRRLLQIPPEKTIRTILPIGVPEQPVKQNARRPLEERCTFY